MTHITFSYFSFYYFVGTLSLYAVFILVTCYWSNMMRKVNMESLDARKAVVRSKPKVGTIQMFLYIIGGILVFQLINIVLFLCKVINSQGMLLYDSFMLSIVAVITSNYMTTLSTRIRIVLTQIGDFNVSTTQPQTDKILAMTRVGNCFFLTRVIIELVFAIVVLVIMRGTLS